MIDRKENNKIAVSSKMKTMKSSVRKALDFIYAFSAVGGVLAIIVICGAILVQVGARPFRVVASGTDEVAAWACASVAFLPLAHTFRSGDMVRITLLFGSVGPRNQRYLNVFGLALAAAFGAYMTYHLTVFVYDSWRFHDLSQGSLIVPIWIPQSAALIGMAIFVISLIDALIITLFVGSPSYLGSEGDLVVNPELMRGE